MIGEKRVESFKLMGKEKNGVEQESQVCGRTEHDSCNSNHMERVREQATACFQTSVFVTVSFVVGFLKRLLLMLFTSGMANVMQY